MDSCQTLASTNDGQFAVASAASPSGGQADTLEAALVDMTATFCSDFADGLVGQRHNTYGHRTRILRQMTGRLAVMREQDAAVTS
jgi:hypothetical protein